MVDRVPILVVVRDERGRDGEGDDARQGGQAEEDDVGDSDTSLRDHCDVLLQ